MVPVVTTDKSVQIRRDSITVDWTLLTGVAAGGENIDITDYEISFRQIFLNAAGEEESEVAGTQGTATVDGALNLFKHEASVSNA